MNKYLKEVSDKHNQFHSYKFRDEFVVKYSWAIPNDEAIRTICKYSPLVEIGAGTGYWGMLIKNAGGKILCFDKFNDGNNPYQHKVQWSTIYNGDESILNKFHRSTSLFLCWPPYNDSMAINCIKNFKGKHLVYIGESGWGCTANDEFFDELWNAWEKIECIDIPRWSGINDALYVYKRKQI